MAVLCIKNSFTAKILVVTALLFNVNILSSNIGQPRFKHLNVESGLSQSWVMCIEQDNLGFMWFGTGNGLNKYDGYNFSVYTHKRGDETSIISNHVQTLSIDESGNIWVGTNVGICYYNYQEDRFYSSSDFTNKSTNSLTISNGIVYAGTADGIFIYNIKQTTALDSTAEYINKQLTNQRINVITPDNSGNIWIGTSSGAYVFDVNSNTLHSDTADHNLSLKNVEISALAIDKENNVWAGTTEQGLFLLNNTGTGFNAQERRHFTHDKNQLASINEGRIQALRFDKKGRLLIGIENGGIDVLHIEHLNKEMVPFQHIGNDPGRSTSLSNNSIYSIFEDKRGDVWIGTYGGGVNFFNIDGDNFKVLSHIHNDEKSLKNKIVNVVKRKGDDLWVGTEGGITVINMTSNKYRHLFYNEDKVNSLRSNAVWAIHFDAFGNAWIGTWAGGLSRINLQTMNYRHFTADPMDENSLDADNIFSIAADNNNDLWIGTLGGGICKFLVRDNKIKRFVVEADSNIGSFNNEVRHLFYNSHKELWFSTTVSVGKIDLKTNKVSQYYPNSIGRNEFPGNGAFIIFEDSRNTMWFGTDVGLVYFNREESNFVSYTLSDGLPSNSVKSIQEDDSGSFWLGTNDGLVKFNKAIFLPQTPNFKIFDVNDGLHGNEFNRRASFKDENGMMYFGGTNGLTFFQPDSIKENRVKPTVVFTNLSIFNQHVSVGDENSPLTKNINLTKALTLTPDQTVFTLEYAALSYLAPSKNAYAYKMEGFDQEWNYVGNKRSATYTNLNPGTYYFKIKAANNDGYWNETPRVLEIVILPPWYKTKWAFVLYTAMLLLSIWMFIHLTQKRFKIIQAYKNEQFKHDQEVEQNQQRLQFFTNISHEFRTPLTLIYSPIENIIKNYYNQLPKELKGQLSIIYKNAHRLNRLATELMDFRKLQFNKLNMKPVYQDICSFTLSVTKLFEEEARLNQIKFKTLIPEKPIFLWYDQHMIEKVLFNLLSNAFKVTPETGSINVILDVKKQFEGNAIAEGEEWIRVNVVDTGPGLDKNQVEKIFERFYQADTNKTYYSSTGIGLSLAKGLMQKHFGDITVKSKPGIGSEFSMWLRTGKEHFPEEELSNVPKEVIEADLNPLPDFSNANEQTPVVNKNVSVLVVEDNKELRTYLVKELALHYKILEAKDGKIGIEMAQRHLPDIIISDVLMPEMDGIELCKLVKNDAAISHIPIILLTARAGVEDQIEGANAGADAYVIKPFNPHLLKSRINQLLLSRKILFAKYSANFNLLPGIEEYTSLDKDFLTKVSDYIVEHMGNPELSIEELSDEMNLSRSQLYRKIKALTGYTATEFLRILRLEQARKLITLRKTPINEAGYQVGFGTPSYFSKCYKEHFGISPSDEHA